MQEKLARIQPYRITHIDQEQYFTSLLREAGKAGLLDEPGKESLQASYMDLLQDLIWKYTLGEGSSVSVQTAEMLNASLLYSLNEACRAAGSPDAALQTLLSRDLGSIYTEGLEILGMDVAEGRRLLDKVRESRVHVDVLAYNDTIDRGLIGFFETYDRVFAAHDTRADIDYPLPGDAMKMNGIRYILYYLETVLLENRFCAMFSLADIRHLLEDYGRTYRIDFRESLYSIFEVVLTNALFAVMMGRAARNIAFTASESAYLLEYLQRRLMRETGLTSETLLRKADSGLTVKGPAWEQPEPGREFPGNGLLSCDLGDNRWRSRTSGSNPLIAGTGGLLAWCRILVEESVESLISEMGFTDPGMLERIRLGAASIPVRLKASLAKGSLEGLLIHGDAGEYPVSSVLTQEQHLPDPEFMGLVNDLLACEESSRKVEMILAGTGSLSDFLDLLEADCLFADDYLPLYAALGDVEIGLLMGAAWAEEVREGYPDYHRLESLAVLEQREWASRLAAYLAADGRERLDRMRADYNS